LERQGIRDYEIIRTAKGSFTPNLPIFFTAVSGKSIPIRKKLLPKIEKGKRKKK